MEKVSVIIPSYNYGHFLSDALDSVLVQTHENWECLIVDDGSTDNTKKIALEFSNRDKRIKYFHKNNGGLSSARNEGLKQATGNFIQFLDADDFIDRQKLEKQLRDFDTEKNLTVSYCNFTYLYENGQKGTHTWDRMRINPDHFKDFILYWGFEFAIPIHCALFRAEFVRSNRILFDEKLKAREDWLFWIQLSQNGATFNYFDEELAIYRKHERSMVHDPSHMIRNTLLACFNVVNIIPAQYKTEFELKYADYLASQVNSSKEDFASYQNSLFYKAHGVYKKLKSFLR